MYFRFNQNDTMRKAMNAFWTEQKANGQQLTPFDSFSSREGECRVSHGGDNTPFEAFLIRNSYSFEKTDVSLMDEYNR